MLSGFAFQVHSEFAHRKAEPQQEAKTTQELKDSAGSGQSWINPTGRARGGVFPNLNDSGIRSPQWMHT